MLSHTQRATKVKKFVAFCSVAEIKRSACAMCICKVRDVMLGLHALIGISAHLSQQLQAKKANSKTNTEQRRVPGLALCCVV